MFRPGFYRAVHFACYSLYHKFKAQSGKKNFSMQITQLHVYLCFTNLYMATRSLRSILQVSMTKIDWFPSQHKLVHINTADHTNARIVPATCGFSNLPVAMPFLIKSKWCSYNVEFVDASISVNQKPLH